MIDAVSTSTTTADGAAAMKKATGMNKDDFLKLFVAQLQNQDPLKPQDGSEFIAQLAQLTQVEQAYNTNSNLQSLLSMASNAATLSSVSFIGKEVVTSGSQVALAAGQSSLLNFRLNTAADTVSVNITDGSGAVVKNLALGAVAAGDGMVAWDGTDNAGQALPSGNYSFAVTAQTADGKAVSVTPLVTRKVDGVRMDGSTPILTAGGLEIPLSEVFTVKEVV